MPSLKTIILSTILSFAARSTATTTTTDTDVPTTTDCPEGWYESTFQESRCCFGHMMIDMTIDDTTAVCCVHDPIVKPTNWEMAGDCFSKIPFTASDYSERVSAASRAAAALITGSSSADAALTTPTPTGPSDTATVPTTGSATKTSSTSSSSADESSESVAPTSNPAMPVATAEGMVLGGAAVAAALFAL